MKFTLAYLVFASIGTVSLAYLPQHSIRNAAFTFKTGASSVLRAEITSSAEVASDNALEMAEASEIKDGEQDVLEKIKPKKKSNNHGDGILSPMVLFVKDVIGDEQLNKVRGKAIALHSDVIKAFVDTSSTDFGNAVLRALFRLADKNNDGLIQYEELEVALNTLGFRFLKEKQIKGIFKRADQDESGEIDMEEWVENAPKTLRTNLVKLAKTNGGELGLLS